MVSGDIFEVERGDGRKVKYIVQKTKQSPTDNVDMAELLSSVVPGKQGLNLITCGGKFNSKTGHYESRDIVFAIQVG